MLVFAALTPHSPLLLPTVGKEHTARLQTTIDALKQLEGHLYAAKPDTVIVITPHGPKNGATYVINFAPQFTAHFEEFSDLATRAEYAGDNEMSYRIKERLETHFSLQLTTVETLDYGTAIPLHFLTTHRKTPGIIPVSTAQTDYQNHRSFGEDMRDELIATNKRVAVIASMEFSSRLSKQSPAGYYAGAKKFDQRLIELITARDANSIAAIKPEQAQRNGAVDLPALTMLMGVLGEADYTPSVLSYEWPFGIGHAVVEFEL